MGGACEDGREVYGAVWIRTKGEEGELRKNSHGSQPFISNTFQDCVFPLVIIIITHT
jgi:hypothetical protein